MSDQRTTTSASTSLERLNSRPGKNGLADVASLLRNARLRPTRQRIELFRLLLIGSHRHFTAEALYEEANRARVNVSLSTVYNTLRQFTSVGLIAQIATDGVRSYFDTNTAPHQHYFCEEENVLIDIPKAAEILCSLPIPPSGFEIVRIDVIARLCPHRREAGGEPPSLLPARLTHA